MRFGSRCLLLLLLACVIVILPAARSSAQSPEDTAQGSGSPAVANETSQPPDSTLPDTSSWKGGTKLYGVLVGAVLGSVGGVLGAGMYGFARPKARRPAAAPKGMAINTTTRHVQGAARRPWSFVCSQNPSERDG